MAWTRRAMLPGKRCSAGRSRNTLSNASGSMLARLRASSPPSRFFSSYGPMKAFSIFTCWSSTIPMSSARGSVSSSWLASSFSVHTIGDISSYEPPCSVAGLARLCRAMTLRATSNSIAVWRGGFGKGGLTPLPWSLLHELVAEPSLHTKMAGGDAVVERRRDLDDRVVLHVQLEHAAHAAVRTHRLGHRLPALIPRAGLSHVVLALEHQRAGGTDADAVAAIDAGRFRQGRRELGRDVGIETTTRDAERKRVLRVLAARLDALVAEDAARVVAHI